MSQLTPPKDQAETLADWVLVCDPTVPYRGGESEPSESLPNSSTPEQPISSGEKSGTPKA